MKNLKIFLFVMAIFGLINITANSSYASVQMQSSQVSSISVNGSGGQIGQIHDRTVSKKAKTDVNTGANVVENFRALSTVISSVQSADDGVQTTAGVMNGFSIRIKASPVGTTVAFAVEAANTGVVSNTA